MIKNLLFDLGNTLEPSEFNAITSRYMTAMNFEIPNLFVKFYGEEERKYGREFSCGAEGMKKPLLGALRRVKEITGMKIKANPEKILSFMRKTYWKLEKDFYKTSNITKELARLQKKFKIYILSNNSKKGVETPVKFMEKKGFIPNGYVSSEELRVEKPDPMFFKKSCEKFSLSPEESVYFGNSLKNDIPPKEMRFVLVYGYVSGGPEDPEAAELRKWINKNPAIPFVTYENVMKVLGEFG